MPVMKQLTSLKKKFYNIIEQAKNFSINEDTLLWMKDKKGKFIVKSAYKYFDNSVPISESWLWKIIRKVKIPHKVACLT
uniref:Putative ovule protein n=1 Tax=Solanum chacoense TaxID=4108 RepID=A0A0V0HMR1_SOLCH